MIPSNKSWGGKKKHGCCLPENVGINPTTSRRPSARAFEVIPPGGGGRHTLSSPPLHLTLFSKLSRPVKKRKKIALKLKRTVKICLRQSHDTPWTPLGTVDGLSRPDNGIAMWERVGWPYKRSVRPDCSFQLDLWSLEFSLSVFVLSDKCFIFTVSFSAALIFAAS